MRGERSSLDRLRDSLAARGSLQYKYGGRQRVEPGSWSGSWHYQRSPSAESLQRIRDAGASFAESATRQIEVYRQMAIRMERCRHARELRMRFRDQVTWTTGRP